LPITQAESLCDEVFVGEARQYLKHARRASFAAMGDAAACGKMAVMLQLIDTWRHSGRDSRVLIFTYSLRLLGFIEVCDATDVDL